MSIYRGLWKKEMTMMSGYQMVLAFIFFILAGFMIYQRTTNIDEIYIVELATFSFIIPPATVLFSLNMEKHQLSMFLFSKQKIVKQIHIKFLHGAMLTGVSFFMMVSLAILFKWFGWLSISLLETMKVLLIIFIFISIISIISTVAVYIAWVLHQWFREKIGFVLSLVALIVTFNLLLKLFDIIITNLSFIANWWSVKVGSLIDVPFTIFIVDNQLSVSMMLVFFIILYVFYRFTTWLLVTKVEV
ncbi:hypothetical protein [Gracilibacillus massiliensis]|uniref:hypothetical protein n=1 Tax=Gracilibacillus massiliensis TaxID=1564956 RepID=UPI00071D1B55|nr:hypothetical protein [Gracilibacillus massiliensis]